VGNKAHRTHWREGDAGITLSWRDRRRYLEITNRHTQTSAHCRHRRPATPSGLFTTLAHLIDADFLREAYRHTSKSSAPGIDGVTARRMPNTLTRTCATCIERLRSGRYQAAPVERVWIEKEDGSQRPIGNPRFEEKIVQRAVAMLPKSDLRAGLPGLLAMAFDRIGSLMRHCTSYESGAE